MNRFDKDYRLEEIDAILAKIKDAVCEILNAVREEQSKIDDSILECEADHDTVLRIVKKAQEILGLDKDKSYLRSIIRYVSAPDLVIPDHPQTVMS